MKSVPYTAHRSGGIVLLSLALILIPTILDFSQDESAPGQREEMPDAPDVMKMEVLPREIWSERIDPEVDSDSRIVEIPSVAKNTPEKDSPKAVIKSEKKQEAKPVVTKVEPKPTSEATVTKGASAWVVQVGRYGPQDNADGVAAQLRKAGFDTVIEKAQVEGQPVYRVQVGPESSQARADQLRQRISDKLKLDGTVFQHPAG